MKYKFAKEIWNNWIESNKFHKKNHENTVNSPQEENIDTTLTVKKSLL